MLIREKFMKNKLLAELIKAYLNVIKQVNVKGMGARWPMPIVESTFDLSIYADQFLAEAFLKGIEILKRKGFTEKRIAELFHYPSTLARLTMIFRTKDHLGLNQKKQIELASKVAQYLSYLKPEDPFSVRGYNILLSPKQLAKKIKTCSFIDLKKESSRGEYRQLLSQIDGKLWLYTELIYSRWHNLGHEFHGPYKSGKENLIIKEWHDLKPNFWSFTKRFPYQKITIFEVYKNVRVKIDMHNRMETNKPLSLYITKFCVKINDKKMVYNIRELKRISSNIDSALKIGTKYISKLKRNDFIVKNAEMEFYAIKPLLKAIGRSSFPPEECYKKIRNEFLTFEERNYLNFLKKFYGHPRIQRKIDDPRYDINNLFKKYA